MSNVPVLYCRGTGTEAHLFLFDIHGKKKRINPVSLHMRIRGVKLQINVQNTAGTFLF